jgi:hypothetical protein
VVGCGAGETGPGSACVYVVPTGMGYTEEHLQILRTSGAEVLIDGVAVPDGAYSTIGSGGVTSPSPVEWSRRASTWSPAPPRSGSRPTATPP